MVRQFICIRRLCGGKPDAERMSRREDKGVTLTARQRGIRDGCTGRRFCGGVRLQH